MKIHKYHKMRCKPGKSESIERKNWLMNGLCEGVVTQPFSYATIYSPVRTLNNNPCNPNFIRCSLLFFLLIILSISACSYKEPYPVGMQQAEHCIAHYPDSALSYLAALETTIEQEPEETQMYYALLTIKAKDKLYIPHTSDSLIKSITHFYEYYGDPDKLMEAYFYLGSVYRDMNDAPQAVEAFQHAADVGENSNRYDLLARIYGQMGTRLAYQGLDNEALNVYRKSLYFYCLNNENDGIINAMRDIARMYECIEQSDSTEFYYKNAYEKAVELDNEKKEDNILSELGCFYVDREKYDTAKIVFSKITNMERHSNVFYKLGVLYQNTFQKDSAVYYFTKAAKYSNIYARKKSNEALSKIEESNANYRSALNYAYKSLELVDTIDLLTKTEAVSKVHALYNYNHIEKENNELVSENEKKWIQNYQLIIVLLSIVSLSIYSVIYIRRKKELAIEQEKNLRLIKEEQYAKSLVSIESNKEQITSLAEQLQKIEGQKNIFQKQLIQVQKELLEAANCKILASRNEKDLLELAFKKSDLYLLFHQVVNENGSKITDNDWMNLQVAIDSTYFNFTNKLYAVCPQLSEQELHICYLIKISIPVKDIAKIVRRSTSAITAARIRLYKKIHNKDGSADLMDKFLFDL